MRIMVRVFVITLVCLALVLMIARQGTAECLRIAGYDATQITDLKTGQSFPRDPTVDDDRLFTTTSPDKKLTSYFQRRALANGNSTFDFTITQSENHTAGDYEYATAFGKAQVLYRNLPEPTTTGGNYNRYVVNAVWLPDSRHILLYWVPDMDRFFHGTYDDYVSITWGIYRFVLLDLQGNILANRTLALPLLGDDAHNAQMWPFHSFIIEGISADGKAALIRHDDGIQENYEMWSTSDLMPVAEPIERYRDGCYAPYEANDEYCGDWSTQGAVVTVIGKLADGNPAIVIHNFDTNQRHVIPLPVAPDPDFLIMPWSPDGKHDVVSWFYNRTATQLVFDSDGNKLGIFPNASVTGFSIFPDHHWSEDGGALLYYMYDKEVQANKAHVFLADAKRLITLPGHIVGDPWSPEGTARRGVNIAVVWNQPHEHDKDSDVKVGVLNTNTGALTILYTFQDWWISDGAAWVYWVSDTRFVVVTTFAFAWGNIDGSGWQEPSEAIAMDTHTFPADGKSVLVSKNSEGSRNIYSMDLDNGDMRLVLSSPDPTPNMMFLGRSPKERYIYRVLITSDGKTVVQVHDMLTNHEYAVDSPQQVPLWSPDDRQFMMFTPSATDQRLQVVAAETGEIVREVVRPLAGWAVGFTNTSFGRCAG